MSFFTEHNEHWWRELMKDLHYVRYCMKCRGVFECTTEDSAVEKCECETLGREWAFVWVTTDNLKILKKETGAKHSPNRLQGKLQAK